MYNNKVIENILSRRSIRKYKDQMLKREEMDLLVRLGMAAPSARDERPWLFIIIDNNKILTQLADGLEYGKMLKNCGGAIVVCGETLLDNTMPPHYWVQDCSAATQNILLGAHSLHIGAVWLGIFPREHRIMHVKNTLKLPENITPLNVISLGYLIDKEKPKDKYDNSKIRYNNW